MVERSPGLPDGVAVEILSPEFAACVDPDAVVERIWTGGVWTEGPAWLPGEGMVVWSDIPNDRMLGRSPATGAISTFRAPAHGANGNTTDAAGRLVTCEQYTRRITRTEPDGAITVLVERIGGRRLTAPNDIVVKSDGTIWFTDPDYGRGSPNYEGEVEIEGCHVYRHDPRDGSTRQMTDDMVMPNGLAFSPDESLQRPADPLGQHAAIDPEVVVAPVEEDEVALHLPGDELEGVAAEAVGTAELERPRRVEQVVAPCPARAIARELEAVGEITREAGGDQFERAQPA